MKNLIIVNGETKDLTYQQIFDWNKYSTLRFITYSFAPSLLNELGKHLKVEGITGYVKDREIPDNVELLQAKGETHVKLYLLSNDRGDFRVITGSANLTEAAFCDGMQELIEIRDDYKLFKQYLDFYMQQKEAIEKENATKPQNVNSLEPIKANKQIVKNLHNIFSNTSNSTSEVEKLINNSDNQYVIIDNDKIFLRDDPKTFSILGVTHELPLVNSLRENCATAIINHKKYFMITKDTQTQAPEPVGIDKTKRIVNNLISQSGNSTKAFQNELDKTSSDIVKIDGKNILIKMSKLSKLASNDSAKLFDIFNRHVKTIFQNDIVWYKVTAGTKTSDLDSHDELIIEQPIKDEPIDQPTNEMPDHPDLNEISLDND